MHLQYLELQTSELCAEMWTDLTKQYNDERPTSSYEQDGREDFQSLCNIRVLCIGSFYRYLM